MPAGELSSKSSTGLAGPSLIDEVGLAGPSSGLAGRLRTMVSTRTAEVLPSGDAGGEAMSSGLSRPEPSSSD